MLIACFIGGVFIISIIMGREIGALMAGLGAMFMGFGGVLASGCSIGNGLAGLSLGSPNSLIAVISIIIGGFIGLRYLENKVT